jgi:hypothetical protein
MRRSIISLDVVSFKLRRGFFFSLTITLLCAAITQMKSEKMSNIREDLTENCSSILLAYRNKCSNTSSPDQVLCLP